MAAARVGLVRGPDTLARAARRLAWVAALTVIGYSVVRGRELQRSEPRIQLGAAPLVGRDRADGWDWRFGWSLVAAAAILGVVVATAHRGWWSSVRGRTLYALSGLGAMSFAVALALTDGADGIRFGVADRHEYLANLPRMPAAGEFVRTFVDRFDSYSVHVRGHPPGFPLVLQALDAAGLGGVWPVAALQIAAVGVATTAVLAAAARIAGDEWMRRAAPFLVVSPYLIWMVSSADAVYTAVGAVGTAAVTMGVGRLPRAAAAWGLAGGLVLGALLFGTYLGGVFAVLPATIVVYGAVRRMPGAAVTALAAVAGAALVVVAFRLAGFWWLDGVRRTNEAYWAGSAHFRPMGYFLVANLAAALIAVGPATFAGLTRLRPGRLWILVGGALGAIAISDLSQYTRAEVERIWLPVYPWVTLAAAGLATEVVRAAVRRPATWWLGAQGGAAILLQAALVTKW